MVESGSSADNLGRPSRHVPALDGIRAVAVLAVMLLHLSYGYVPGGFLGVDLFFVLSGYLITRLLLNEFDQSGGIRFDLFYLRRVYRLVPPIVLLLLLVLLMRVFVPDVLPSSFSWCFSSLAVLFFFANFLFPNLGALTHTWSLSVEEQFYFLWPGALFLILKSTRRLGMRLVFPLVLVIACAVLRACLESRGSDGIVLYTFLFTRMDSLLLGAVAAMVGETPKALRIVGWLNRHRAAEMILLGLIVFLIFCEQDAPFLYYGGFTVIAFFFAVLLLAVVHQDRVTALMAVLQSQAVVWIGKRSYGIYLYHYPIFPLLELFRVKHSVLNFVLVSLARLIIPILAAGLSYRYVELPFLRKKVLFKWNIRKAAAEPDAATVLKDAKT
jgi:peptidoglycan/LPS O-acetylase OafA/YrhL